MAMDYKQVLEKLKKASKGSSDRDYIELTEGKNMVRVCPGHPNMEGFFEEVHYHNRTDPKNPKKRLQVICFNHGDPRADACDVCRELEPLSKSTDKADKKLYNEQKAKARWFCNVIDRADDDKVKILGMGITILKGILGYVTDEDYGDVLSLTEGRDMNITKSGEGMDTEYEVKAHPKTTMLLPEKADIKKLIGTSAEDCGLYDLTELKQQFADEPEKVMIIWEKGWDALKNDDSEEATKAKGKALGFDKDDKKAAKKGAAAAEPEPEDEPAITSFPKLKSLCSVCGENRYKTPGGNVCANGHGGVPPLADGAVPSDPSKAALKAHPEWAAQEEPEAEEEEAEAPKPAAKKPAAKPATDSDDDLDDLDSILAAHSKGVKK